MWKAIKAWWTGKRYGAALLAIHFAILTLVLKADRALWAAWIDPRPGKAHLLG
jgi:hypothetical protein